MLSDCIGLLFSISANTLTAVVFISTVAVVWCYLSVPRLYVQSRWGAFPWRWRAPWLSNTERWPVERRYAHCCLREGWQLLGEGVSAHRQTNTVVRHDFIIVSDFSGEVLIKWPQGVFMNEQRKSPGLQFDWFPCSWMFHPDTFVKCKVRLRNGGTTKQH